MWAVRCRWDGVTGHGGRCHLRFCDSTDVVSLRIAGATALSWRCCRMARFPERDLLLETETWVRPGFYRSLRVSKGSACRWISPLAPRAAVIGLCSRQQQYEM